MSLLLLLDANYTCMISPLLLLHMCPQYITPASGILSNHTFYVCGQVRKLYFGLTGLLILEILVQIMFVTPWNCFPWLNCRQPCKTVPEPLTVTQNMLRASSVGWVALFKAERGTYTPCSRAGWGSCINQVSLSSSNDVLEQEKQSNLGASLVLAADASGDCTQHKKKNPREKYEKI